MHFVRVLDGKNYTSRQPLVAVSWDGGLSRKIALNWKVR